MNKPKEILELEEFYGIELMEVSKRNGDVKVLNIKNSYDIDVNGNVNALNLTENKIEDISPLKNIKYLITLDLSNNQIDDISPIKNLTNLEKLKLNYNLIIDLSPLNNLQNLSSLDLDHNQIVDISPLSHLQKLCWLSLENNQIIDIATTKNLQEIEFIFMGNNQIVDISCLKNLLTLEFCSFEQNSISDLTSIKKLFLKENMYFDFGENPLEENLIQLLKIEDYDARISELEIYFTNLEKESKPLNEAKLMILGEGNAGKSNLRNYILGLNFDDKKSATVGIAIDRWQLHKNNTDYRINIWDFGGQWLQQQVHKFFITNESLYIILLKARTEDNPNQWLEWIKVYAPNSKAIVVINRMDELHGQAFTLTENSITKEYPFVVGFHYISLREANFNNNTEAKLLVDKLRVQIEEELTNLPNIHAKTPLNYFNLKTEIEDKIFVDIPFISIEYFEELVKQKDIVGDTKSLLNVYDRIGTLRYFKNTS